MSLRARARRHAVRFAAQEAASRLVGPRREDLFRDVEAAILGPAESITSFHVEALRALFISGADKLRIIHAAMRLVRKNVRVEGVYALYAELNPVLRAIGVPVSDRQGRGPTEQEMRERIVEFEKGQC